MTKIIRIPCPQVSKLLVWQGTSEALEDPQRDPKIKQSTNLALSLALTNSNHLAQGFRPIAKGQPTTRQY